MENNGLYQYSEITLNCNFADFFRNKNYINNTSNLSTNYSSLFVWAK